MEIVEIAALSDRDRDELIDEEPEPWGALGEGLSWREKDRRLGLRDRDGRLAGLGGVVIADVAVEHHGVFEVVGLGGVFITRARRGQGLMRQIVEPLLALAREMGPERALLFCRPELVRVYSALGFAELQAPVWVDQPEGPVRMPMRSMWLALREGAAWPPGRVDVRGLPF